MELKYNLTIDELMEFICGRDFKGYTEDELQSVEQKMGLKLPQAYRDFLLKYGEEDINTATDYIYSSLDDLITSYEMIHEILEDLEEDFKKAEREGKQEEYSDNEYFSLWKMPEEKWNTITQNYLILGCDREGISHTGYLLKDVIEGKDDMPVYASQNDDIIEYKRWTDNTEQFLIEVICETAWEDNMSDYYAPEEKVSVEDAFKHFGIDIDADKFKVSGHVGTCLDTLNDKLYVYFDYGSFQRLFCYN